VFRVTATLPEQRRQRALLGDAVQLLDLVDPVDPEHDHLRGPEDATVTVVEYGDFQCPYCGQAERAILAEQEIDPDVRYVWRHLPLTDVHPQAQLAAEATEAAAAQDAFWSMHDLLLANQDKLTGPDLLRYARQIGLDERRFREDLMRHAYGARIARDVESADASGVSGTPTFFVNGQRYTGRARRPHPGPGRRQGPHPPPRVPLRPAQRTGRRASWRRAHRYEPSAMTTHQATATIPSVPIGVPDSSPRSVSVIGVNG